MVLSLISVSNSNVGPNAQTAAAPPTISESSFVIAAWRDLL
jgi:hypothetical protein